MYLSTFCTVLLRQTNVGAGHSVKYIAGMNGHTYHHLVHSTRTPSIVKLEMFNNFLPKQRYYISKKGRKKTDIQPEELAAVWTELNYPRVHLVAQ